MIYLSVTQSQEVVVTLKEKSSLQNEYWTWNITNRDSFNQWTFSAEDFSNSNYYNSFTVSIGPTLSATGSVVLDAPAGQYDYRVYQTSTQWDLNVEGLEIVESGVLIILGTQSEQISFTASNDDTIRVFNEL